MAPFSFGARVVRIIDGDTVLVDPMIYPQDTFLRVRFRDRFAPEPDQPGGEDASEQAEAMFPAGVEVTLVNTRSRWTYNRLEARVDHA